MEKLIEAVDEVIKWGIYPHLKIEDKERLLEESLVQLYSIYFEINYEFDETEFPDFDRSILPDIQKNIASNFPDYGLYHSIINHHKIDAKPEYAVGDAIDDLADIIIDLLEVKWSFQNNSERDASWHFELSFQSHMQWHLLSLLTYIKSRNR